MDENNMVKFKVLSWNSVYYSLGITERSTDKHPVDNTVTVTAKGAVIIRMSWERPVEWTPKLESRLIYACSSLCDLVRGCC